MSSGESSTLATATKSLMQSADFKFKMFLTPRRTLYFQYQSVNLSGQLSNLSPPLIELIVEHVNQRQWPSRSNAIVANMHPSTRTFVASFKANLDLGQCGDLHNTRGPQRTAFKPF
jgi:hypothetical protein